VPEDDAVESTDGNGDEGTDADSGGVRALVERQDEQRWAEAIVTGGVTYVVGYLITASFFFLGPADPGKNLTLTEQLSKVGVVFNAGHYIKVDSSHPLLVIQQGGEQTALGESFNFFRLSDLVGAEQAIPKVVYLLLPVVLLLTVGFSRAYRISRDADRSETVVSTLGMAVGYGGVTYLGTLLFSYPLGNLNTIDGTAIYANTAYTVQGGSLGEAVVRFGSDSGGALLSGIGYPLALATFGAIAALTVREALADDEDGDETDESDER
jgi:hypothetical protein